MTQKVLKVGSSAAITIPKAFLERLGVSIGDRVEVNIDEANRRIVMDPRARIDGELVAWTKKFIEAYRPALEELAKK